MSRQASKSPAASAARALRPGDLFVIAASIALLTGFMSLDGGERFAPPPDFADMPLEEKKRSFFAYLSPIISAVNFELAADRERVRHLIEQHAKGERPGWLDRRWLGRLAERLDVPLGEMALAEALETLERRAGIVPESLVLVQAAVESGWGTSRFASEGNNYFGQRCYRPDCGMVPEERRDGRFGLARFASVADSVESYILNLNTHPEYREFRELRKERREAGEPLTGLALVEGLSAYSERGEEYVEDIAAMIRSNNLE